MQGHDQQFAAEVEGKVNSCQAARFCQREKMLVWSKRTCSVGVEPRSLWVHRSGPCVAVRLGAYLLLRRTDPR